MSRVTSSSWTDLTGVRRFMHAGDPVSTDFSSYFPPGTAHLCLWSIVVIVAAVLSCVAPLSCKPHTMRAPRRASIFFLTLFCRHFIWRPSLGDGIYRKKRWVYDWVDSDGAAAGLLFHPVLRRVYELVFVGGVGGCTTPQLQMSRVRCVFLLFRCVCGSRWGSDSCLMCMLSCHRPHARVPPPPPPSSPTLPPTLCAETAGSSTFLNQPCKSSAQLKIRDIARVTQEHLDHQHSTPVWSDSSATLKPMASATWSALLTKPTLPRLAEHLAVVTILHHLARRWLTPAWHTYAFFI